MRALLIAAGYVALFAAAFALGQIDEARRLASPADTVTHNAFWSSAQ